MRDSGLRALRALVVVASVLLETFVAASAVSAAVPAVPIPSSGQPGAVPSFVGMPADPVGFYAPDPPRHPFMAPNGRSELHNDAYQSDTNQISGPLGRRAGVLSTEVGGDCASVTFDARGRIVAVCVGLSGPRLYMFDPSTLATLASFSLPGRLPSTNPFQDFTGGGYFYLDHQDRVVVATTTRHLYVIGETGGSDAPGFALQRDYDLTSSLPAGERITSALPDWSGRIWVESFNGVLVVVDPATGAQHSLALGEETENSFAVDETGGVYVVSNRAMYRLDAAGDEVPRVSWREVYANSHIHKPGQVDAGSGTTPTVQGPYVTITDNADPLDIVVYRRARVIPGQRLVCSQPVFPPGQSADENSLIGAGNTMIAENNYGYTGPTATSNGRSTAPGLERVDVDADGRGCHVVWTNSSERIPTVVSKLSLASGLIYAYTKSTDPADPWYFTALDVRTGQVIYRVLTGTGSLYNNNYAPVTLGPDGSAYIGTLGGLVEVRDATAPQVPLATAPNSHHARGIAPRMRPGLRLRVHRLSRHRVRVSLAGDRRAVARVRFLLGGRHRGAGRAPFSTVFHVGPHGRRRLRLRAVVRLRGGATVRVARRLRRPRH